MALAAERSFVMAVKEAKDILAGIVLSFGFRLQNARQCRAGGFGLQGFRLSGFRVETPPGGTSEAPQNKR